LFWNYIYRYTRTFNIKLIEHFFFQSPYNGNFYVTENQLIPCDFLKKRIYFIYFIIQKSLNINLSFLLNNKQSGFFPRKLLIFGLARSLSSYPPTKKKKKIKNKATIIHCFISAEKWRLFSQTLRFTSKQTIEFSYPIPGKCTRSSIDTNKIDLTRCARLTVLAG
jgi:hypothetical protein